MRVTDPSRWRISLLGGFRLTRVERPTRLPRGAQRVLAYAALHAAPAPRRRVAGTLWPDTSDPKSLTSLRSALLRLHQAGIPLEITRDTIGLDHRVRLDVTDLVEVSLRPEAADDVLARELAQAGELLPDWDEEWLEPERERYRQLRLHLLEDLCERAAADGRYGDAIEFCLAAVAEAPLRESAQRTLIAVHIAEGNRAEAIRQFHIYEEALSRELGLRASPDIERLIDSTRSGIRKPDPFLDHPDQP